MKFMVMVGLMLVALNVGAADLSSVPHETLGTYVSNPGESKTDFLLRIAPAFRAYSNQTGFEACGMVASNGQGQFGVVMGTSHAHISCVNYDEFPEGMTSTGDSIHSHGVQRQFSANSADMALMSKEIAETLERGRRRLLPGQSLDHFSPEDYRDGPGFLVTPSKVIYQHGFDTDSDIGTFAQN